MHNINYESVGWNLNYGWEIESKIQQKSNVETTTRKDEREKNEKWRI